jgi:triosephosphate isomerase (TIM)
MPKSSLKKKLVVANWKMNPGSLKEAKELARKSRLHASKLKRTELVLAVPSLYIEPLKSKGKVKIGAQNSSTEERGSYTGELSVYQLKASGVTHVILGHSERRKLGETDEFISKKVVRAVVAGLTPIVCVGEAVHDADGAYLEELKKQVLTTLSLLKPNEMWKVVLAYEPIWAIGAAQAMTPHDIYETTLYLKKVLTDAFGPAIAPSIKMLYGGSADANNAADIMKEGRVDGLLVGRQSLEPDAFKTLLLAVDKSL